MIDINEMIEALIENKKIHTLYKALNGENEFSDEVSLLELDRYSTKLKIGALQHLEYLSYPQGQPTDPKHITAPAPEYFDAWKLAGCPGLSLTLLSEMVSQI